MYSALLENWSTGTFALNTKEQTLLGYMLFQEAVYKRDYRSILLQGMYLIEEERINNHAIELVVEYADVLSSMNPQPGYTCERLPEKTTWSMSFMN